MTYLISGITKRLEIKKNIGDEIFFTFAETTAFVKTSKIWICKQNMRTKDNKNMDNKNMKGVLCGGIFL